MMAESSPVMQVVWWNLWVVPSSLPGERTVLLQLVLLAPAADACFSHVYQSSVIDIVLHSGNTVHCKNQCDFRLNGPTLTSLVTS